MNKPGLTLRAYISFLFLLWVWAWFTTPTRADIIRVAMKNIPGHFHPYANGPEHHAFNAFFSWPLVFPSQDQTHWECGLCSEIPSVEKQTLRVERRGRVQSYVSRWKLRSDIRWSDGQPISAQDVILAWKIFSKIENPTVEQALLTHEIDQIRPLKNRDEFEMDHFGISFDATKLGWFFLVPSHIEQAVWLQCEEKTNCYFEQSEYFRQPSRLGLHNGPFVLGRDPNSGKTLTLEPNKYFGLRKADVKTADRLMVSPFTQEHVKIKDLSDFDIVTESTLPLSTGDQLQNSEHAGWNIFFGESLLYEHLSFNIRNPDLADSHVRHALLLAIDRSTLVNEVTFGKTRPASHMFSSPWWPKLVAESQPAESQDLTKSRKLLEQAGWHLDQATGYRLKDRQPLVVDIVYCENQGIRSKIVERIALSWQKLGIKSQPQQQNCDHFFKTTIPRAEFRDAAVFSWNLSGGRLPKAVLHSKEIPNFANRYNGSNVNGWRHPKADKILEDLDHELMNPENRLAALKTLVELMALDVPHLPLFFWPQVAAVRDQIEGFTMGYDLAPSTLTAYRWRKKLARH